MKNKNYMKNDEKELSTKRYALNNILGDPSKLEEARKLANYEKPEPAYKRINFIYLKNYLIQGP